MRIIQDFTEEEAREIVMLINRQLENVACNYTMQSAYHKLIKALKKDDPLEKAFDKWQESKDPADLVSLVKEMVIKVR